MNPVLYNKEGEKEEEEMLRNEWQAGYRTKTFQHI